jgi:1-deoxy-D-xylulose-5-phosphate reductoisomerase
LVRDVLVLGATGSIGRNALEVIRDLKSTHRLVGISGHTNHDQLIQTAREYRPTAIGITDPLADGNVRSALRNTGIKIISGPDALLSLIKDLEPDIVLNAVSGAVGLLPALVTLEQGKRLALANK